ncbi:MAG: efflux RND transporter permease subunit, partial [Fibrobacterales bacterium]
STIELHEYAEELDQDIIRIPDAASMRIQGVQQEQVYIDFDNAKLASLGISSSRIKNIISSANILFSGGKINIGTQQIIVEPSGNFESLEQLKALPIRIGNSTQNIPLGDICSIYKAYKEPTDRFVRVNGSPAVVLSISLKDGSNIVHMGAEVDKIVDRYTQKLPIGVSLYRVASDDLVVQKSVNDFAVNLLQSMVIVLIVMLLFLGLKTGFIVASLIPSTIIVSFALMGYFEIGLNKVSLAALIMALGMLVDNAIVMSESIMVKMNRGKKVLTASIESANELGVPLLTSSLTTSAAFLAFFLAESTMGEVVGPLFVVITIALLASLILALTLIPLLSVMTLGKNKAPVLAEAKESGLFAIITRWYSALLKKALKHSVKVSLGVVVLFFLSLMLFKQIPFIFVPDSERNLVTLDMNLPLDTRIENTDHTVALIEKFIQDSLFVSDTKKKGVINWSAFIGKGPESYSLGYQPGEANSGYAHLLLNTSSGNDNLMVMQALEAYCRKNLPDADVKIARLAGGGGGGYPVEIRLFGDNSNELYSVAQTIKSKLRTIPGARKVGDTWGIQNKKIKIEIDQVKALLAGLTSQDIALSLRTTLSGFKVGEYRGGDEIIAISMREAGALSITIDQLENSNVYAQGSGMSVPLSQVARIEQVWEFPKVLRRDMSRTISVTAYLEEGYTASEITRVVLPWIETDQSSWPRGISMKVGGESENSKEGMQSILDKLPLSGFIILILLIIQFNSIRKTAIVLSTVPLGITGVILGLLLTGSFFSFYAFLGVIALAGIVVNNAIVLIDRIDLELGEEKSLVDAIQDAAKQRFRPIVLTTATTICGMIPLWISGGLMWQPMAIGLIFGLLFATIITLILVPNLYKILYKKRGV